MPLMHTYRMEKLVRDSSLENMTSKGTVVDFHRMEESAYLAALAEKLREEADELINARTLEDKKEELADVLEIVVSMAEGAGISLADLETLRQAKRAKRGGFDARYYVTQIHCPVGSFWDEYCAKDPVKYLRLDTESC